MTAITINDIHEDNYNALAYEASYLQDLTDDEVNTIQGGWIVIKVIKAFYIGYEIGKELSKWF
ncbi:hypothetical protein [Anabaena sp. 4-3]|uniref:hypothetical protein n=1 Tax=Anabaena sp. 4-3 TaxID=1811979 RepID=UPI00082BDECC|nr:hypothetical protein [Anabaena sp. 4-3]